MLYSWVQTIEFYPKHRASLHDVPSEMMSLPYNVIKLGTFHSDVAVGDGASLHCPAG